MTEIVEFLRARLDEDAALASKATGLGWTVERSRSGEGPAVWADTGGEIASYAASDVGYPAEPVPMTPEDVHHIARWNPARVLAEVETKRRLLARHDRIGTRWVGHPRADREERYCMGCDEVFPCETVRLLALPYSQHPD